MLTTRGIPEGYRQELSSTEIEAFCRAMAQKIVADYWQWQTNKRETPLVVLINLTGAMFFGVDLCRLIEAIDPAVAVRVDTLAIRCYGDRFEPGKPIIEKQPSTSLKQTYVVLVEDIFDSGLTLAEAQTVVESLQPARLVTAVLFEKPASQKLAEPSIDYAGLPIAGWVAGRGLDDQGRFRARTDLIVRTD